MGHWSRRAGRREDTRVLTAGRAELAGGRAEDLPQQRRDSVRPCERLEVCHARPVVVECHHHVVGAAVPRPLPGVVAAACSLHGDDVPIYLSICHYGGLFFSGASQP
jgi:hypothetical protein